MKILLQILLVIAIIVVLFLAVSAAIGMALRIVILLALAAIIVTVARKWLQKVLAKRPDDAAAHARIEVEAEQKLKELENRGG